MSQIAQRLKTVQHRIEAAAHQAGRNPADIRLLAVSKTQPTAAIDEARQAGQMAFGESYVQEAIEKITALNDRHLEWHFIGPVQSNKTQAIAAHFDWLHSLDRLKIAQRLNDQRPDHSPPLQVCIQVNTSHESTKSGIDSDKLPELVDLVMALPRLQLRGLMTIPAPQTRFEKQREPFAMLKRLYEQLREQQLPVDTLSMGMSQDLEAAIAEGATIVRIGTAIFGER